MDLQTFIQESGGTAKPACPTVARVAKKAGCSAGTLYQVMRGLRSPSWKLAASISKATDGKVGQADLRPDIFGADPTRKPR